MNHNHGRHDTFSGRPTNETTGLSSGSKVGVYTLVEPLGQGGMGQVWKANDGKRAVALKLLPPEFRGNADAIAQVDEAFQVVHALTHQHICKTLGRFDDPQYGPFLVLDYIPGIRLSQFQKQGDYAQRRVPLEIVVQILRPVAEALGYAHQKYFQHDDREQQGVLHRDVKPDNILIVVRDGIIRDVLLIDFGLAAEIRNTINKHTNGSADSRGTRHYMSPEQLKGKRHLWDGRTDQYSLAVVAYELLAGHLPFDCDDEFSLMLAITQEPPDPIDGLTDDVNAALQRGLAKDKTARFSSCVEFVQSLSSIDSGPSPKSIDTPLHVASSDNGLPGRQGKYLLLLDAPYVKNGPRWAHFSWRDDGFCIRTFTEPERRHQGAEKAIDVWNAATERIQATDELYHTSVDDPSNTEWWKATLTALAPKRIYVPTGKLGTGVKAGDIEILRFNNIEVPFCWCPPGKFKMGSPQTEVGRGADEDQVDVELTRGFWMGQSAVTQELYEAVMQTNPSGFKGMRRPVEQVTWDEASLFCQKLDTKWKDSDMLPQGWTLTLPTEAEWEFACRAGTATAYSFGNSEADLSPYAWFDINADKATHDVGQKRPNPWGLFDMHGNVWEWCADWGDQKLTGGKNPVGPSSGSIRVFRGGSWFYYASFCRSACRSRNLPGFRSRFLGMRVAGVPTSE